MVTTSKATLTLTLILVALVGCGPKPAPKVDWTKPITGYRVFEFTSEPPGPPIDSNPYRFIGGQRYGEGWPAPRPMPACTPCALVLN